MAVCSGLLVLCVYLVVTVNGLPLVLNKHTSLDVSYDNLLKNGTSKNLSESTKLLNDPLAHDLSATSDNATVYLDESNKETNLEVVTEPVVVKSGVCDKTRGPLIYTENFILENDKKSQVFATMKIGISGNPNITCVELISRSNDKERPSILSGGVGSNFVEVGVSPGYGSGFDFTVQLFGSYNLKTTILAPVQPTEAPLFPKPPSENFRK